ncbi:MAG: hypothetical protein ACKO7B_16245 [Flavobacteriales bacterium]
MLFNKINLQTELIRERKRQTTVLDDVHALLEASANRDKDVLSRLGGNDGNVLELQPEDQERIFALSQIRSICVKYRLRFLDSKYFKSEYPYEAVTKINAFEKKYGVRTERFKIIAPDHLFDLQNINKDPLLFAELADGRFYLIHKWGNDLSWHRKILGWPLQSFRNYFIVLMTACFLCSFLLPTSILNVFNAQSEFYLRVWLSLHLFIGLMGMTLWFGLTYDKTFSNLNWDSKYYNY